MWVPGLVLAPLVAGMVACGFGPVLWLMLRMYFDPGRAALAGVTAGLLAGGTLAVWSVGQGFPPDTHRYAYAGWVGMVAALVLGWVAWLFARRAWWPVGAGLGLVSIGGIATLAVYWHQVRYRNAGRVVAAGMALLALFPLATFWWLWHVSAGFGTRGEPGPARATQTWMADLFPGALETPYGDVQRVTCSEPAGRRQVESVIRPWQRWPTKNVNKVDLTVEWFPDHTVYHGSDRATVSGTVLMHEVVYGYTNFLDFPNQRWTFTVVNHSGWRVCGVHTPNMEDSGVSPTPTASGAPVPGTPTPSASRTHNPVPPTGMEKCGPNDPYRSMGWYTCPAK
jgi:hypothetical protein